MALFTVTGCTSVEMNQTKTDTPDDNTQGNATTLSCADYTLNPLWNWAETPANQLIVIRSQAELADFIFPNDKLPEDIDFEKNTLLLVAGQATNGIESVKKNFVKADAQYIYSVTFLLNDNRFLRYLLNSVTEKLMLYSSSQSNFSTLEESFLSYLSERCPDQTFSGVEKMAMQLHCSRRQLQRVLKKLLEEGRLVKLSKGSYRLS